MPDMKQEVTRREFLKAIGGGAAALAFPLGASSETNLKMTRLGRVTAKSISVYEEPSDKSRILFQRYRDEIVNIYFSVTSEDGPGYNPIWHRVWGGYMHSGYVQPVRYQLNPILDEFPSSGQLMELTVPYSNSYIIRQNGKWDRDSQRLYYSSTHYAFGKVMGPDNLLWYKITFPLTTHSAYIPGTHLRKIEESELTPIHQDINPREKRIEISIDFQTLKAFEGEMVVKEFQVSTGLPTHLTDPGLIPTDTPKGNHIVRTKRPSVYMGEGASVIFDPEAYELPGVPWVSYFVPTTGVAIHGTYWHNNYGVTMSHGCVNMRSEDAKWIYRWSSPYPKENAEEKNVYHTPVYVS